MPQQDAISYWKEFLKSPHHGWLAVFTLGSGFVSGLGLPLLIGAGLYALGWVYFPDSGFFKAWVNLRRERERELREQAERAEFNRKRAQQLASLSAARQKRCHDLAAVCQQLEDATRQGTLAAEASQGQGVYPRLRRLEELMWTFLRLLTTEQTLQTYLDVERKEDLQRQRKDAEIELTLARQKLAELKTAASPAVATKTQVAESRQELLEVLNRRCERLLQADDNLDLVRTELQRLEQQVKLIRADAVAVRNAEALSARIDATVNHLETTNRWLSEMDPFRERQGELPLTDRRLGSTTEAGTPATGAASTPAAAAASPTPRQGLPQRLRVRLPPPEVAQDTKTRLKPPPAQQGTRGPGF